jgi:hypothetical protein
MGKITALAMNILKWLDCGGNVVFGGLFTIFVRHHVPALGCFRYTCSEAWDQMRDLHLKGQPIWMYEQGCIACRALTWLQNNVFRIPGDHCTESMEGIPTDIEAA